MPTDDQTEAEALDDDELSEVYPPDHLLGADEYGTTAAEERVNEPIEQQVLRELPDHLAPAREEPPTLIATADGSWPDDEVFHEGGDGELLGLDTRRGSTRGGHRAPRARGALRRGRGHAHRTTPLSRAGDRLRVRGAAGPRGSRGSRRSGPGGRPEGRVRGSRRSHHFEGPGPKPFWVAVTLKLLSNFTVISVPSDFLRWAS